MRISTTSGLVFWMSVALAGAVSLQIFLIGEAVVSREDRFDKEVAEALRSISTSLETVDLLNAMSQNINFNQAFENHFIQMVRRATDTLQFKDPETQTEHQVTVSEIWSNPSAYPYINIQPQDGGFFSIAMHQRSIKSNYYVSRAQQRRDSLMERIALRNFQSMLPMESRFQIWQIDSVIRTELKIRGIAALYRFAITEGGFLTSLATADFRPQKTDYFVPLFKDDFLNGPRYLFIDFPDKTQYLYRSMWTIWLLMVTFLLAIVLIFGRTLYQMQRQKKISRIKTDFINNMTHEFKTPIATISLAIDALNSPRSAEDLDRRKNYYRIIKQESQRMNHQVEQVLQMALFDKNELDLKKDLLVLSDIVRDAIEHTTLQLEERGGTLSIEDQSNGVEVVGDALHLTNVFTNILDNAVKYSTEAPEITVNIWTADHQVFAAVKDKGRGMSKEVQKQIFDRFYRETTGDVHDIKGHGLGLAYAIEMVKAHRGNITVASEKGKGSTFTVSLPYKSIENS